MPTKLNRNSLCEGPKVMAFWKYDLFPYVLCAEGYVQDDGWVYCPSYQSKFFPLKVMEMEDGMKLKDDLAVLTKKRRVFLDTANELWNTALNQLLPERLKAQEEFWKEVNEAIGGDSL